MYQKKITHYLGELVDQLDDHLKIYAILEQIFGNNSIALAIKGLEICKVLLQNYSKCVANTLKSAQLFTNISCFRLCP